MKTFVRLIRRYVLAAVGIVLLLLFSGVAVLGWLGWQESCRLPQREYSSSEIADSMVETAEGLALSLIHIFCAKLDAALGETERYAGEQARYNSILAELSAWLRRREMCIRDRPLPRPPRCWQAGSTPKKT